MSNNIKCSVVTLTTKLLPYFFHELKAGESYLECGVCAQEPAVLMYAVPYTVRISNSRH